MKSESERAARLRELTSRQPAVGRREHRFCRHCDDDVMAIAPSRGWALSVPVLVVATVSALITGMLIGPFALIALLPIVMLALAVGPYIAALRSPPVCSQCHRETPYATRDEARMAGAPDLRRSSDSRLVQPGAPGVHETAAPGI